MFYDYFQKTVKRALEKAFRSRTYQVTTLVLKESLKMKSILTSARGWLFSHREEPDMSRTWNEMPEGHKMSGEQNAKVLWQDHTANSYLGKGGKSERHDA